MKLSQVDLHLHTVWSDGSDTVPELMERLKHHGVGVFAITDHDTIAGALRGALSCPDGMEFYRGVELSCRLNGIKCHILGYDYDPEASALKKIIEKGRALRREKLEKRLTYLEQRYDIRFSPKALERLRSIGNVGKPHLAQEITKMGRVEDIQDAFSCYLRGIPGGDDRVNAAEAIQAIRDSGGIAVWAHPLGGEGKAHHTEEVFRQELAVLCEAGIQGIECFYSRYSLEEAEMLVRAAEELGLLISGGSDCHGANKTILPGELNTQETAVDPNRLTLLLTLRERKIRNSEFGIDAPSSLSPRS